MSGDKKNQDGKDMAAKKVKDDLLDNVSGGDLTDLIDKAIDSKVNNDTPPAGGCCKAVAKNDASHIGN